MVYRQDNRKNKHKGRYTVLGIVLGVILTGASIYLYDHNRQPILDNVNEVKQFAIKQIHKDSPVIAVVNDNPVVKPIVTSQSVDNTQQVTQPVSQPEVIDITNLENSIHKEINNIREQNGLKPLTYDEKVADIAREHSQDMANNNYFDHTSSNGKTFQDRVMYARIACYPAGENIEENYQSTPNLLDSIMETWINSPEHKLNILSPFYSSEGIGVAVSNDNVLITDDFC